jgi:hypothetical protein
MFKVNNTVLKLGAIAFNQHESEIIKRICEDDSDHLLQYLVSCDISYNRMYRGLFDIKPKIGPFCHKIFRSDANFMHGVKIMAYPPSGWVKNTMDKDMIDTYCQNMSYLACQRLISIRNIVLYFIRIKYRPAFDIIQNIVETFDIDLTEKCYIDECKKYDNIPLLWYIETKAIRKPSKLQLLLMDDLELELEPDPEKK